MKTIQIDNYYYEYYEYNEVGYEGAEEINAELEYLRLFLKKVDDDIGLADLSYQLVVYEEKEIDAFVTKNKSEYLMGISKGTFVNLRNWFKMIFSYDKTYDVMRLQREKGEHYTKYTYRKALEFLVLHEYTHMKDGHCDIPENESKLIFEQSKTISREEALFSQILELGADSWAATRCVDKIVKEDISAEEKNEKLKLLMFSIYTIFKKFSEYDKYDFNTFMDDELLKYTHPMVWIRYRYIVAIILTNINNAPQEYKDILKKYIVKIIMDFESQVLNISNATEKMFTGAHTLKGTKHLILLNNSWNEVADKLEGYTHAKLLRVRPINIDAEKISIVDMNESVIL